MKIKKIVVMILLSSLLMIYGCGNTNNGESTSEVTTPKTNDETTKDTLSTTAPEKEEPKVPKPLKILAIGNSFSVDCMQYLYQIAKSGGVETIVLGNVYYGGCSLAEHLSFANADSASYTYYKNTSGSWVTASNYKMSTALLEEEWDIITLQQSSKTSGIESSYGNTLKGLINYVKSKNNSATLVWNMTWAYQQDSTHASFPSYSKDQTKMYNMIVSCVENSIKKEETISSVIPTGTAIQNARTSFLGDKLTRDGYHLDYNIGRYIAGLTWFTALTGVSPDNVSYNPSTQMINEDMIAVAKEAVKNAINTPNSVTESKIKEGTRPNDTSPLDPSIKLDPADFIEADQATAQANGVDITKYTQLSWEHLENTYWNSTSKAGTTVPASTASTYKENICSKKKYAITELPVGTVFIVDAGWQYRLEIFPNATSKYTGSRPGMTTAQFFLLSEQYLGGCTYISWNIASNPKGDISNRYAQAACHLRIYVPNK